MIVDIMTQEQIFFENKLLGFGFSKDEKSGKYLMKRNRFKYIYSMETEQLYVTVPNNAIKVNVCRFAQIEAIIENFE